MQLTDVQNLNDDVLFHDDHDGEIYLHVHHDDYDGDYDDDDDDHLNYPTIRQISTLCNMLINCDIVLLVSIVLFIIFTNVKIGNTHGIVSHVLGGSSSSEYSYEESGSYEHSHGSRRRHRPMNRRRRQNRVKPRRRHGG